MAGAQNVGVERGTERMLELAFRRERHGRGADMSGMGATEMDTTREGGWEEQKLNSSLSASGSVGDTLEKAGECADRGGALGSGKKTKSRRSSEDRVDEGVGTRDGGDSAVLFAEEDRVSEVFKPERSSRSSRPWCR